MGNNFPGEIKSLIYSHSSPGALCLLSRVSKSLYKETTDPSLWTKFLDLYKKTFRPKNLHFDPKFAVISQAVDIDLFPGDSVDLRDAHPFISIFLFQGSVWMGENLTFKVLKWIHKGDILESSIKVSGGETIVSLPTSLPKWSAFSCKRGIAWATKTSSTGLFTVRSHYCTDQNKKMEKGMDSLISSVEMTRAWRTEELTNLKYEDVFTRKNDLVKDLANVEKRRISICDFLMEFVISDIVNRSGFQVKCLSNITKKNQEDEHSGRIAVRIHNEDHELSLQATFENGLSKLIKWKLEGKWLTSLSKLEPDQLETTTLFKPIGIWFSIPERFVPRIENHDWTGNSDLGRVIQVSWDFEKTYSAIGASQKKKYLLLLFTRKYGIQCSYEICL